MLFSDALDDAEFELRQSKSKSRQFARGLGRRRNPSERFVVNPDRDVGSVEFWVQSSDGTQTATHSLCVIDSFCYYSLGVWVQ